MGQRPLVLTANNFNQSTKPKLVKAQSKPEATRTMQNSSKFDVNNYVNYLKKVDQGTNKNQTYHIRERG
jgi:hypothetical protein